MIAQILWPVAGTLLCYLVVHVIQFWYRDLTSPIRHLPGPPNPSLFFGNFKDMANDAQLTKKWRDQFGANFRFKGLFSTSELHTADIKAVNHIVANSSVYQRAPSNRRVVERLLGRGILSVELDEHKRHRRAMNPAFGIVQIRVVTEIFVEKAAQLRDLWASQVAKENGEARIEVLSWARRMTLDVIGQAGFNYQFDSLTGKSTELEDAFTELFHSPHSARYSGFRLSQALVPVLKLLPLPGWTVVRRARNKMYSIGSHIVSKTKADIKASEGVKTLGARRDLLSILLKANMSTQIPESQRLSEAEVIAQVPAFFLAGHETTSSAISWALHALSVNTAAQSKLRDELLTLSTDNPTMDELNSLPYLESVVRETMRAHSPVVFVNRMAMEDDVLPLSKPYLDKAGNAYDTIPIRKGQMIHIAVLGVNTDKDIWGEDAAEFKPERWEKVPESTSAIPGAWAHLFTFFAGPHNCIGFRFSLAELKALLFTLVRAFEFEAAVPPGGIGSKMTGILQRPSVLDGKGGSGLPLILRPYNQL